MSDSYKSFEQPAVLSGARTCFWVGPRRLTSLRINQQSRPYVSNADFFCYIVPIHKKKQTSQSCPSILKDRCTLNKAITSNQIKSVWYKTPLVWQFNMQILVSHRIIANYRKDARRAHLRMWSMMENNCHH